MRRVATAAVIGLSALAAQVAGLIAAPAASAGTTSTPPHTVRVYDRSSSSSFVGGDSASHYQAFPDGAGWTYSTPSEGSLTLSSTNFMFIPSWPARNLTLTLRDPNTGAYVLDAAGIPANGYQCQGGTINVTSSTAGALGSGFMQCYNAAKTLGFYVRWAPFPKSEGGGGTPCLQFGPGAVPGSSAIDSGTSCMAHVSVRKGGNVTLLTEPGTSTPECFMISFRLEADPA